MSALLADLIADIESKYIELGHAMDWRFLTVPRSTFEAQPDIVLLTLNPGGEGSDPTHGRASCENGSAYRVESWGKSDRGRSALQLQVQSLLDSLRQRVSPTLTTNEFMDHHVLGAHYLPFRSPSLEKLPNQKKSFQFAGSLWVRILTTWTPRLVVTIDHKAFSGITNIFTRHLHLQQQPIQSFITGWGKCRADVARFISSDRGTTVLRLPHLSTYKLFSREQCTAHLRDIIDSACIDLRPETRATEL
jgi:hypothetical protein